MLNTRALPWRSRDLSLLRQNAKGRPSRPALPPHVGAPVASLRCRILRTGILTQQLFPAFRKQKLDRTHSGAITTPVLNPLLRWPVLKCSPMAGFQVITEGRLMQGINSAPLSLMQHFAIKLVSELMEQT